MGSELDFCVASAGFRHKAGSAVGSVSYVEEASPTLLACQPNGILTVLSDWTLIVRRRRSARLKIPAQAFGDKQYFSGAFSSKIRDKKQAPAPLCCSEILTVVDAPSEINSSASCHSGVRPLSILPSLTAQNSRPWTLSPLEVRAKG